MFFAQYFAVLKFVYKQLGDQYTAHLIREVSMTSRGRCNYLPHV